MVFSMSEAGVDFSLQLFFIYFEMTLMNAVEPPIMDSPRYRTTSLQRTNNVLPIDFAIEIIYFQPPKDGQPPACISRQWTENVPQRKSSCTK